ncbi:MAG: hypothetical protein DHS20C02_01500 [Micavibrio sp.]|nr:MAG: hypothetical protein DHS20C02_01500 [Micavibrio sp.]
MFSVNFRIIPLLVFVAMLAFSFRVVEIVTGFSTLSGAALAVEEVDAQPPEMPPEAETAKQEIKEEGMMGVDSHEKEADAPEKQAPQLTFAEEEEDKEDSSHEEEEDKGGDIDWRDASDSDLDYTEVRMELFEDLSKRRKDIVQKERQMLTREALLRTAEKELDRKFQELSQLRGEIESLLEKQSEEEQGRVQSLVKIYEGMKPKDAARIFNTLDLDILVTVMGKMSERKLSPVLAKMNPERARTVTIMLAEQKQLPSLPQSN